MSAVPLGMPRKLRLYARERPKDARGFLSFLIDHGFTGLIPEHTNGPWFRLADLINSMGLELGVSDFPHPAPFLDDDGDDEEEEGPGERALRRMVAVAKDVGAKELHPDPETGYVKTRTLSATKARQRRFDFRDGLEECSWSGDIVVTSYPSFPIEDFVAEGTGASSQLYDRFDTQPFTWAKRWIAKWRTYGFAEVRAGVGIYKLVKKNGVWVGEPKPIARQKAYLASFPSDVDGDVWTLRSQQLNFRQHAAHYRLLRDWARG